MSRLLVLGYGAISYLVFFLTFLYAIGFVGNLGVPKGIDSGSGDPGLSAILVDMILLGIFGIQHSVMARPGFKTIWTRIIPPVVERSTYVLVSSLALILLYWQWRPIPAVVWNLEGVAAILLTAMFWSGWVLVLVSTFLIDHFELFGLRQSLYHFLGRELPPHHLLTPGLYRFVRHPIMLGFLIAFWSTPRMSQGHLLFAVVTTVYVLLAIQLEERDLVQSLPEYEGYRQQVSMLIPGLW